MIFFQKGISIFLKLCQPWRSWEFWSCFRPQDVCSLMSMIFHGLNSKRTEFLHISTIRQMSFKLQIIFFLHFGKLQKLIYEYYITSPSGSGVMTCTFCIPITCECKKFKNLLHKGLNVLTTSWYSHHLTCIHRMTKYYSYFPTIPQSFGTNSQKQPSRLLWRATDKVNRTLENLI